MIEQSKQPTHAPSKAAEEHPRTKGERIFNYLTYGGIGFGLNLGLSVLITDYFTHGKGEKILRLLTNKSTSAIHGMSGINPQKLESAAYGFWKTNLLMSGGHVVMIPIKMMEDNKRHMVHRINRLLGIDQPILKDGKEVPIFSLSEDELPHLSEDQPKQSWFRTAYRRVLGISATMTLGTMMGKQRQHDVEDFLADKLMLPGLRAVPMKSVQTLTENDRFQRYARLVSLDQFFTFVTSRIAYLTNGAKKHTHEDDIAETSPEASTVIAMENPQLQSDNKQHATKITADHIIANAAALPQLSMGAS